MVATGAASFSKERGSISSLNIPKRFQLSFMILRLLCLIPSSVGVYRNLFDVSYSHNDFSLSLFQNKSTPLIHHVALLWCLLAGYWSWILTTSMLKRWIHHYEIGSAIVRLITLTVINWSVSAYLSSYYGIDQPIWQWMTICLIFFVSNILKITLASNKKNYARVDDIQEPRINHKSTFVRVLILPLTVVVFITMFASMYQVAQMRKASIDLLEQRMIMPSFQKHPQLAEAEVRVMVFVLSAWTAKSAQKRQVFRETTLKLMPKDNQHISYFYTFILGQPPNNQVKETIGPIIDREIQEHNDVLILPCSDLYQDLSRKVYAAFEWAEQYDFDYFVKTDDDIFVRWDTISKEMELAGRTKRYWRGLAYHNIPPIRNTENKNGELIYPLPVFPPYTAGALYILSRDVVHLIAGVKGPRMFVKNEDQNLGIWLYPFNILPIHDRRIQQIDVCENDMIGKHFGDFGEPDAIGGTMYDMLDNLQNGRKMCAGFKTSVCGFCYPCHGKANHWKNWNFDCDDKKGVTLLNSPPLTIME
ncbi:galactosyltransferase-domain-containing protein [Gilbertella persicaria]|uniref:galactosyltransferase-domain-containing protein n=1 Tax=Gilbertella persicaria TaxID=101096 RepID=UPI0022205C95|nr:galactosyltransferase-domain-containing protein [Gilbertella persicaria]KAI8090255.1 galactosyltransferase-domain-containing protein [Gilbertella persicaria]